ncbi:MAG: SNF2-related protein, partial [Planctomycetota bacterium]|nr:SNF2-related protein [Planctomycetota bacterium]
GIYKRYSRDGIHREDSKDARTAQRVREFLGTTPVMLLTATPIQNSLAELWGLVQFVEPTGTLLGSLATFREVFAEPGSNDRVLVPSQATELRRRINTVCQRTLRRQAQEFLEKPFTRRQAMLFKYEMSRAERRLYDDVTSYLMEPKLCAFRGNQRRLLLISFHRLMASSHAAFSAGLSRVAERLKKMLDEDGKPPAFDDAITREIADELEDEDWLTEDEEPDEDRLDPADIQAELERVEGFIRREKVLRSDAKALRMLDAVRLVQERGQSGAGSGKVVIFTESLTTQKYIRDQLVEGLGLTKEDITLFRGSNDSTRAKQALQRWREEIEVDKPRGNRPSPEVAVRIALVHEFETRSRVFISTEAGAKGLNLQFCDTLINYDLPWNPQRIEQRIGRCHRYSQTRDVTVVNFLASDNEAQRLMMEILTEKLDLFGQVLDASDVVLHEPKSNTPESFATAMGADFETQLRRIYERARSPEDLAEELRKLSEDMSDQRRQFEEAQARMEGLIESRFDDSVRSVFRKIADELPSTLAELDLQIEAVVCGYMDAVGANYKRTTNKRLERVLLKVSPCERLAVGLAEGFTVGLGPSRGMGDADPLHLAHPLVVAAVEESRAATDQPIIRVAFSTEGLPKAGRSGLAAMDPETVEQLRALNGKQGRLVVTRLTYRGFEPVERLLFTAVLDGALDPLDADIARQLVELPIRDLAESEGVAAIDDEDLEDAVDEAVFLDQSQSAALEQQRFERLLEQIERYADDQSLVLKRRLAANEEQREAAVQRRDAALGADARTSAEKRLMTLETEQDGLELRLRKLEGRDDEEYRRWSERAHKRRYVAPEITRILNVEFVIE